MHQETVSLAFHSYCSKLVRVRKVTKHFVHFYAGFSALCIALLLSAVPNSAMAESPIRIGSKNFNENYLLAEMIAQLIEARGLSVERRFGLGGTLICYEALKNDEIDLYVEYTGTLSQAILKLADNPSRTIINQHLEAEGLQLLAEIGFNNTYAIAVRESVAQQFDLVSIGDLARVTNLPMVFSHEFLEREDGWPGLKSAYALTGSATGIEHGLAYQAISEGAIGVTDAYSTDGELVRYDLRVLNDDLNYFPNYNAAPLTSLKLPDSVRAVINELSGTINDSQMQALNAQVVFEKKSFAVVASNFLQSIGLQQANTESIPNPLWASLIKNTLRHLQLTGIALSIAIVIGLLLALLVYRNARISAAVIYFCGLMQTIPSIALLALMIPLFGIGMVPAIIALFLYSLLPILRNAVTALANVEPSLVGVCYALGMTQSEQLRHILLPLSAPAIFAGIRTAAVISIGTATLAAFIGAGGLGDPIVVGLSLNDSNLILQGAIPAALLADTH